jgi:hypothetical protein
MTLYVTKQEYRAQKARLTRAKNSGDPLAVLAAVEKTLDEWSGKAWPDGWHRWSVALGDAYYAYTRLDDSKRLTPDADRFHAANARIH